MRIVIQRVLEAEVVVEGKQVGSIGKGLLLFLGVGKEDTKEIADKYLDKILKMRIFADENGKTNRSLQEVQGEILVVSQFTLYADCKRGNRPDFIQAAGAEKAREIYEYVLERIRMNLGKVEAGMFGEDMKVSLVNDGPFTIILDETLIK
ncbi:D-tyrosyl-tRNA(Tyr) deacylase [Lachnospiraceae bacterium MD1]|uniref:D-aminoacyl-tRNA deacylase n=1 Tax=Variimorphobacter saccharofermentans TaxID=2755051 RepID=A0A839K4I7_9FIRM|nr:D-aminoacyl-tRNA deacylase [Variimorphobacter saccharofermentans]MBB2184536.1 D-tyrosyl-tRNA(Tyr) deacylase [Variimorphobacter saccharofermentans]